MHRMGFIMNNKAENKTNNSVSGIRLEDTNLTKMKRAMTTIRVEIEPSAVFSDAAKYIISSANRMFRNSVNTPIVDVDILERYFFEALVLRVNNANPEEKRNYKLSSRSKNYPLPAIVYNAIRQVGQATDKSYNVRFIPVMTKETLNRYHDVKVFTQGESEGTSKPKEINSYSDYVAMSDDDFTDVLNMFLAMEDEGYVLTGAMSTEIYGDIQFMAMTNVENTTKGPRSYRDVNPVYAFYRSFFYNQQLAQLCDAIYTYQYNDMDEMSAVLRDLVFSKKSFSSITDVLSEYR